MIAAMNGMPKPMTPTAARMKPDDRDHAGHAAGQRELVGPALPATSRGGSA